MPDVIFCFIVLVDAFVQFLQKVQCSLDKHGLATAWTVDLASLCCFSKKTAPVSEFSTRGSWRF